MYYKLQVSEYSDFSELVVNKIIVDVTEDVITYGLDPNVLYYWRTKSINNLTGKESVWSDICWFITRPDDIIINQGFIGSTSGVNVIVFESGNNIAGTCFAPDGLIGDTMCRSVSAYCDAIVTENVIGSDTLGSGMCAQNCSELL